MTTLVPTPLCTPDAAPGAQDAALRRNLTSSVNQRVANSSAPLGLFEAQFLGTVPVEQNTGQSVCNDASESLLVRYIYIVWNPDVLPSPLARLVSVAILRLLALPAEQAHASDGGHQRQPRGHQGG